MNAADVLGQLKSLGSEQCRRTYVRHGVKGPAFGVRYGDLGKLKRQIKTDHALAKALWASGYHDAQVLATMIADPAQMSEAELDSWSRNLENYVLTDAFSGVAAHAPSARKKAEQWIKSKGEWISTAGWNVIAKLAGVDGAFGDDELLGLLDSIEQSIHSAPNRTRYAMNNALIAIGSRGGTLQRKAIAAARRIGKVLVDHGDTGCHTPDAATYIQKVVAFNEAKRKSARTAARA